MLMKASIADFTASILAVSLRLIEADDIGKGMAYDVIDGYSHAFEDYDLEEVEEGIEWEVWPVRDNTGLSVSELDCEFANLGRSLFIDEYCCVDIHNT